MVATRDLGNITKEQLDAELVKHTEGAANFQKKLSIATQADALRAEGNLFEAEQLLSTINLKSSTTAASLNEETYITNSQIRLSAINDALSAFGTSPDSPVEASPTAPLSDERTVLDTEGASNELVDLTAPGFEASTPPTDSTSTETNLFDPPTSTSIIPTHTSPNLLGGATGSGTTSTSSVQVPLGSPTTSTSTSTGGTSANINDIAQGVSDGLPTGGNILSDVGASILQTRSNIESLLRRKRTVGFSDTRLAAKDKATVARRTLLSGNQQSTLQGTSTKKAEKLFKGKTELGTILGRSK